jgi:hypothetical protein
MVDPRTILKGTMLRHRRFGVVRVASVARDTEGNMAVHVRYALPKVGAMAGKVLNAFLQDASVYVPNRRREPAIEALTVEDLG